MNRDESLNELYQFIKKASASCYAGGGRPVEKPEREGFIEYKFTDGDWDYGDSFTGSNLSWGSEVVRYQGKPIWMCSYGGEVTEPDNREQTRFIIKILKEQDYNI